MSQIHVPGSRSCKVDLLYQVIDQGLSVNIYSRLHGKVGFGTVECDNHYLINEDTGECWPMSIVQSVEFTDHSIIVWID